MLRVFVVFFLLAGAYSAWASREASHFEGALAPFVPQQYELTEPAQAFERAGFNVTPVARFDIEARVLGREIYRSDTVAELAPVDLALGWGPMSDSRILKDIRTSQANRFFYWSTDRFPIPRSVIENSSTNTHLIPATAEIEARLKQIRVGEIVHVGGLLVNAYRPTDGRSWKTSLRRDDSGDGACEIIYVTNLEIR
ncbi:MAG TPA: hypothetical protein VJU83_11425 [Burkholderiales bacterium]|nr:hypothetical protein [Burkholderiales bacterium]